MNVIKAFIYINVYDVPHAVYVGIYVYVGNIK